MEKPDGVAAAADAGDQHIRQATGGGQYLLSRFRADDTLEVAYHNRIWVRAERGAQHIIRILDVGHPVAHGLADGFFQGAAAGGYAANFRAEQSHSEYIEALASHILFAHIHDAFK